MKLEIWVFFKVLTVAVSFLVFLNFCDLFWFFFPSLSIDGNNKYLFIFRLFY